MKFLTLILSFFLFACEEMPTQAQPTLSQQEITVGPQKILAEIADDDSERRSGLMFREELPEGEGMLFVWDDLKPRVFWMKNTPLPLDMIFIHDSKIVGFAENAKPFSEEYYHIGEIPANAVLEVPAGYVRKHKIKVSDSVNYLRGN